jgi:hypothetical protein
MKAKDTKSPLSRVITIVKKSSDVYLKRFFDAHDAIQNEYISASSILRNFLSSLKHSCKVSIVAERTDSTTIIIPKSSEFIKVADFYSPQITISDKTFKQTIKNVWKITNNDSKYKNYLLSDNNYGGKVVKKSKIIDDDKENVNKNITINNFNISNEVNLQNDFSNEITADILNANSESIKSKDEPNVPSEQSHMHEVIFTIFYFFYCFFDPCITFFDP